MSKRLFQVLDEMNVNDEANKTATCACCFDFVAANKVKAGGHVTMGVPAEMIVKMLLGEVQPILILMDKKEYHRLEATPVEDKLAAAEQQLEQMAKALEAMLVKHSYYDVIELAANALTDYNNYKQGKDEQ